MLDAMNEDDLADLYREKLKASAKQSRLAYVKEGWITSAVSPQVKLRKQNLSSPRKLELLIFLNENSGWITCPDAAKTIGANVSDTAARLRRLLELGLVERREIEAALGFGMPRHEYQITDAGREFVDGNA